MQQTADFNLDVLKGQVGSNFKGSEANFNECDELRFVRGMARQIWKDFRSVSGFNGGALHDGRHYSTSGLLLSSLQPAAC